jgi:hypothetical protein
VKRILISAGVIVALVFPAGAQARIRHETGTVTEGGTVSADVKIRHRHARKVLNFTWNDVPLDCTEGSTTTSGNFTFALPVKHDHFSGTGTNGVSTVHVAGDFTKHGKREHGIFRAKGTFGTFHNCDSGKDHQHMAA